MTSDERKTLEALHDAPTTSIPAMDAIRSALDTVDALTQQVADLSGALVTIEERLRVDAAPLAAVAQENGTRPVREAWKAVYSSAVHAQCFIVPALSAAKEAP